MDGYIKILQKFVKQCVDLKYKVLKLRNLKYILQFKTQIKKLFWLILFYNKWYMRYVTIQLFRRRNAIIKERPKKNTNPFLI